MKAKERYYYLDILKFIAIFLVCCYHFSWVGYLGYPQDITGSFILKKILFGINSMCMPLFFMVNGALLLNKKINGEKFIKKSIKLLGQFYIWRFITILIISFFKGTNLLNISKSILLNALFFGEKINGIDCAHFWFIPLLFSIYLIVPLLNKFFNDNNEKTINIFMFILLILCIVVNDLNIVKLIIPHAEGIIFLGLKELNPFRWIVGPMLFYFMLGGLLHKYRHKIKIRKRFLILILLCSAVALFGEWYIQASHGISWDIVFNSYDLCTTLLMSSAVFLLISRVSNETVEKNKKMSYLLKMVGDNTLTVYYCHWIFGYTILPFIWNNYVKSYGIMINAIKAILLVLIFSFLGKLLKKIPIINKIIH